MPVFEDPQGAKKSTALRTLSSATSTPSDTPIEFDSKDRFIQIQGSWCHEIAEVDAPFDKTHASRIKSFVTSQTDKFRPPYGRANVSVKRQVVFAGTVNRDDYLRDETGGRRFYPVRCGSIDVDALRADRELLWAEAVALYESDVRWWPEGSEAAACAEEQAERLQRDEWVDAIETWLATKRPPRDETTVREILAERFKMSDERMSQGDQNRVARALRLLNFKRTRRAEPDESGVRAWFYRRVPVVPHDADEPGPAKYAESKAPSHSSHSSHYTGAHRENDVAPEGSLYAVPGTNRDDWDEL